MSPESSRSINSAAARPSAERGAAYIFELVDGTRARVGGRMGATTLCNGLRQKGSNPMGDKKGKKEKAKGDRQKKAKQAKTEKQKQEKQQSQAP
jgi:hypothetical protein